MVAYAQATTMVSVARCFAVALFDVSLGVCQQFMPVVFSMYAHGSGSIVMSRRQTRALSQDNIMHRPAVNHLDNDFDLPRALMPQGLDSNIILDRLPTMILNFLLPKTHQPS